MGKLASIVVVLVAISTCTLAAGPAPKAIGRELCKRMGFTKPIRHAEVDECNVVCYSNDRTLSEEFERDKTCGSFKDKKHVCQYGECFPADAVPKLVEEDYSVVEIIPKKIEAIKGKLPSGLRLYVFIATLPSDSLTYNVDDVLCRFNAKNKANITSVEMNSVCKTRIVNKKALLGLEVRASHRRSIDEVKIKENIAAKLDQGVFEVKGKNTIYSFELKSGKRKPPSENQPSTPTQGPEQTTKSPTSSPNKPKKRRKPKTTTTTTPRPSADDDDFEE